ncbi:MAG: hypothetical protein HQL76_15720 [Magnetococcales bacterium]|nr:hypothetical protein [Magnetococcales bacterium]
MALLEKIRACHDGPGIKADPRTVAAAVAYFRQHERPDGWRGLKYACFGAGSHDETGWCLLSLPPLREKLFSIVQNEIEPRRKIKCFQALLFAYWQFPRATAGQDALLGWTSLRDWLKTQLPAMNMIFDRKPDWFSTLGAHANLLQENPCDRYGPGLYAGDSAEFAEVIESLAIPSDSWVQDEAIIVQVKTGISLNDDRFKNDLDPLLSLIMGKRNITLSRSLQTRCLAMLISRYARCSNRVEHMALRDAAVSLIGNPWLQRTSWDANVIDDRGMPDADAREMIDGWLKRCLITDFFELLSVDRTGDARRLNYWLRFAPFINDMWFALGVDARSRRGENFEGFRSRAKGRLLDLERAASDNNAFIMRIGEFVAVEFSASGNALYVYRWHELPNTVMQKLMSGLGRSEITIDLLKSKHNVLTIKMHRDRPTALESWEQKFDRELCPLVGYQPEKRPAFVPDLEKLLANYSVNGEPIKCEDRRPQGGALGVYVDDSHNAFSSKIKSLGFNYQAGRGWFRE